MRCEGFGYPDTVQQRREEPKADALTDRVPLRRYRDVRPKKKFRQLAFSNTLASTLSQALRAKGLPFG